MSKQIQLYTLLLMGFVLGCGNTRHIYSLEKTISIYKQKYESKENFAWNKTELKFRYSVAMHSDSIFSISYKPESIKYLSSVIHEIDLTSDEWVTLQDNIIEFILEEENNTFEEIFPRGRQPYKLPIFLVKIKKYSTLIKLLERQDIIDIEPYNVEFLITR